MATPNQPQHNDIDIVSLGLGLRRSLKSLLMLTLFVGVATFGVLSLLTPRFMSEAQLAISAKSTNPFPEARDGKAAPDGLTQRLDREAINTHVNALRAPDLLLKVARELRLAQRAEYGGAQGGGMLDGLLAMVGLGSTNQVKASDEQVVKVIRDRLLVAAARESRFIAIRFSSSDPKLAADFVNTLAESYRQGLVDVPVNETQEVVKALMPKIEQLKKELLTAEAEVERFRAETDQFRAGAQSTPVHARRMAALNDELIKMETARSAAESKWKTAKEVGRSGHVEVLPEVQSSPVIQRLIEQRVRVERQVAEARASLLPAHPRMKQLNSDLQRVRSSIRREVATIVRGFEKEFRIADFRVQDIRREINALKSKVVDTSENEARLKSLESSAQSKRSELERLQRQLEDNKTLVVTKTVPIEAQIVSLGRPSSEPVFPKKVPYTLLAMVASLILGLAFVTAKEIIMAGRDRTSRAAKPAYAPAYDEDEADVGDAVRMTGFSPGDRARRHAAPELEPGYRGHEDGEPDLMRPADVARHLLDNGDGMAGYRSIIVGDHQSVDPAPEGLAIARQLSRAGKQVIVVDWNVDGETFAGDLDMPSEGGPGILGLLSGKAAFDEIIDAIPKSRVHYTGAGRDLEFEDQELDADGLNAVLDALDEAYDQVLVIGRYGAAQALFEAIQGRFDTGVTVRDPRQRHALVEDDGNAFLGFEVADIKLVRCLRVGNRDLLSPHYGDDRSRLEIA